MNLFLSYLLVWTSGTYSWLTLTLRLDIVTLASITAAPNPLLITTCGENFTVAFTASATAVSGHATVSVISGPAVGDTYVNQVDIPITVT